MISQSPNDPSLELHTKKRFLFSAASSFTQNFGNLTKGKVQGPGNYLKLAEPTWSGHEGIQCDTIHAPSTFRLPFVACLWHVLRVHARPSLRSRTNWGRHFTSIGKNVQVRLLFLLAFLLWIKKMILPSQCVSRTSAPNTSYRACLSHSSFVSSISTFAAVATLVSFWLRWLPSRYNHGIKFINTYKCIERNATMHSSV